MEFVLGALVVVAVLAFVVMPLVRGQRTQAGELAPLGPVVGPADERAAIYRELLELDLDQKVGKVADADYRELSDALLARAAALISEEDADIRTDELNGAEAEVEREIAAMRATLRPSEASSTEEIRG